MTTLKETAVAYKGKKELTDLDKISVNLEMQQGTFTNNEGKEIVYNYIEIDGYKYTVKGVIMNQIKRLLEARPTTTSIKITEEKGEFFVMPLD